MRHISLFRAAIVATAMLWLLEWLAWNHLPATPIGRWSIVTTRAAVFGALGLVAVRRGRRWSAPLVPLVIAVLATLAVTVVGVATGQFALRRIGPALTVSYLLTTACFALIVGGLSAGAALLWQERARAVAQAG